MSIDDARAWIDSEPDGDGPIENVLIAGMKYCAAVADDEIGRVMEYETAFQLALADCLAAYEDRHGEVD
jgi:hypothetical protein